MSTKSSMVRFKINTAGSWANLGSVTPANYSAMKKTCERLAQLAAGDVRFMAVDADGRVIEQYGPIPPSHTPGWYEPHLRRA